MTKFSPSIWHYVVSLYRRWRFRQFLWPSWKIWTLSKFYVSYLNSIVKLTLMIGPIRFCNGVYRQTSCLSLTHYYEINFSHVHTMMVRFAQHSTWIKNTHKGAKKITNSQFWIIFVFYRLICTLYNAILRIVRNFLETRENIKIRSGK